MNLAVDIIIILILVIGALMGLRRGFARTVARPVKLVGALWLAFTLSAQVAERWIQPHIYAPVAARLEAFLLSHCEGLTPANAAQELPTLLRAVAAVFHVDVAGITAGEGSVELVAAITAALAEPFARFLAVIIAFVVVYLLSRLLLSMLFHLLHAVLSASPLSVCNRIAGLLLGALLSFISVWLGTGLFTYLLGLPAIASTEWAASFTGGAVYAFFRDMDLIALLLSF